MHVAVHVHGEQVVERPQDLGLGQTGLGGCGVLGLVFSGDGAYVVDDGVALGYAAVGKAPAVVDVAGVAAPGVLVHGHGHAGVIPVGAAGGDHDFVGSVLLKAPEALAVYVAVFSGKLRISVCNERGELGRSLEVVLFADVGENFRRQVGAGREGQADDCKNDGIYLFHIRAIIRSSGLRRG